MELFNRFNETIFYKNDSELEYQLKALKKVNEKYPNNEKILQKIKICELGLKGENEIEFELKNANIGMYVLHDVNIAYEDLKAQIDYIVITPAYIYFIECKNLVGNIIVNENGDFIREYSYNGRKIKEGIYSPIRQAERHVEVFKKIWNSRNVGILDKLVRSKNLDEWYRPLAVMANSRNILNVKYAPKEIKNKIIKSDALINYIKKDISKVDKDLLSMKKSMHKDAFSLMQNYNREINRDYEKELEDWIKKNIKEDTKENIKKATDKLKPNTQSNENLKIELINFRKTAAKEKNIPAYYVFTNDELEKILKTKPRSIQELRDSGILADVKIRTHGKKIIEIINKY